MGQSSHLSPYTPKMSWLWPQSKLPVQPKQSPNSLLLHHLLSQASPCLSQGALFILSPVGSWPGRCRYSHYDSHMETEIQGDEGVCPRFSSMAQKWLLTWVLLYRGLFILVASPCWPQRAVPPTCTPVHGFPFMPSHSGSLSINS